MGKKFSKPNNERKGKLIDPPVKSKEEFHVDLVKFSFKYLSDNNPDFKFQEKTSEYFVKVLQRLTNVCTMTLASLKYPKVKALRNHYIDWAETTQSEFGLPNEEQLVDRPFQFGISSNEHGRVIGFFIDHVFYIVWLDPDHN